MFFRSQYLNILCLPMNKDLSVASKQLLLFLRSEIPSVQHWTSARSCSNKETGSWSLIQKYLWPIHFANPGLKILAFHLIKLPENVYVFYCRTLVGRKTSTGRMVAGGHRSCHHVYAGFFSSSQCFSACVRENHPQWGEEARPGNAIVWFYLPSISPLLPVASTWQEQTL